jgi:thiamine-monophosphate kinase
MDRIDGIGERKAIEIISRILENGPPPFGIGDDVAIIDMGEDYLLVTTDMITRRTHTPMATADQIGWHLVAINLSDIGSKGGRPIGIVTALGLPNGTDIGFLKGLVKGMKRCASQYGTRVLGGDTKESKEMSLTGTAFGIVPKDNFMARRGARSGDLVAITGELGLAAAGLECIKSGFKRPKAIKALLEPVPRVVEGIALGRTGAVTSCMDTSDGLSSSLYHLARASGKGFMIDHEKLPISAEVGKLGLMEDDAVLHFGGEYELLMTIDPEAVHDAKKAIESNGCRFTIIGKVVDKGISIKRKGNIFRLEDLGWEHFRSVRKVRKLAGVRKMSKVRKGRKGR